VSPVKKFAIVLLLALVLVFGAPPREAFSNYHEPGRQITVIVPFGAGAPTTSSRGSSHASERGLGLPVVVINVVGASGGKCAPD
jgi:tripartite-type tricarboxylate transporter receptor subunit TctC